jgi:hypothetical protein
MEHVRAFFDILSTYPWTSVLVGCFLLALAGKC